MSRQPRRDFLKSLVAGSILGAGNSSRQTFAKENDADKRDVEFGISLYGMRSLKLDEALEVCAKAGYDCVELVAIEGWPCDPAGLNAARRKERRDRLDGLGLNVAALMEDLNAVVDADRHRKNLDRLKAAAELGHALSPGRPPVIETVLGGSPKQWNELKTPIVRALTDWAKAGESAKSVIAAKAHIGGALHTPTDAAWLIKEVGNPWLKLVFDYSHFQLGGFSLEDSLKQTIGETVFVHVKDTQGTRDRYRFLLPGDGQIDYRKYCELLKSSNYRGPIIVEVSGQIHGQPGYDPIATCKHCYTNLAPVLSSTALRVMPAK